jgi:hypothetical protein
VNKQIIGTLNRLCGEVEHIQHRIDGNHEREVYEAVMKAKDSLLDAIRLAEQAA